LSPRLGNDRNVGTRRGTREGRMTTAPADAAGAQRLKDATLVGVRWISIARIAGELIAFASMVALARLIGPSEFGKFAIALVVQEIALTITGEGIGTALVQRRNVERAHLEAGMFLSISIGIVLGVIAFMTAPLIFTPLFGSETTELVRLSTPMFVLAGATAVPLAIIQRRLDFRLISLVQIFAIVVRACTALVLAIAGFEAGALVVGALAGSGAMMVVLQVVARAPWPRPRLAATREISGFGIPAALSGLSWTGFRN
jgi:O-antigen/teichoic acid export membrane protein